MNGKFEIYRGTDGQWCSRRESLTSRIGIAYVEFAQFPSWSAALEATCRYLTEAK